MIKALSCRASTPPESAPAFSVHGANRLGTNSLVDIIVFGKHAGLNPVHLSRGAEFAAPAG